MPTLRAGPGALGLLAEGPKDLQNAEKRFRRAMERTLKVAGLPSHFTPHSLRHTFCSLLIGQGVSPVYVQQQAGHADVTMTVGVYGSWFALEAPGAMDRLAAGVPGGNNQAAGGNMLAAAAGETLRPTGTSGRPSSSRPSPG